MSLKYYIILVVSFMKKKLNMTRVVLITWIVIGILSVVITLPIHLKYNNIITLSALMLAIILAYEFVMRIALGGLLVLPKHNPDKGQWVVKEWELRYFDKHNYKERVKNLPTFNPKQYDPTIHTTDEIIENTCKNEFTHKVYFVLTYLPIVWCAFVAWYYAIAALVIAAIVCIHDVVLISFQRFSRQRLIKIRDRQRRVQQKN